MAALALDHRLAQLVQRTSEPVLGQMRLAWWRETLGQPAEDRPRGDAVLDTIAQHWDVACQPLIGLVDGWEQLLDDAPLGEGEALAFAHGRAGALLAALGYRATMADFAAADAAAQVWALADLAAKVSDPDERTMLITMGTDAANQRASLSARGRALAVLRALGARALAVGGQPLMTGRTAALAALRAAIFRR